MRYKITMTAVRVRAEGEDALHLADRALRSNELIVFNPSPAMLAMGGE